MDQNSSSFEADLSRHSQTARNWINSVLQSQGGRCKNVESSLIQKTEDLR